MTEKNNLDKYTGILFELKIGLNKDNAYAFRLEGARDAKVVSSSLSYTEVGANFNPEMGYLKRENYRKWSGRIFTRIRPKNDFGLLEVRPHINYDGYWKLNGFHESGRWHIDNHTEFRSGFEIHTGINLVKEGVLKTFEIYDGVNVDNRFSLTDLEIYYAKLSNGFNLSSTRDIDQKYPASTDGFAPQRPEFEIVGAFASDPLSISSLFSGDGATPGNVVTVTTSTPHGLSSGTPIKLKNISTAD